jgi:mono/diheme cytochrome c family protein
MNKLTKSSVVLAVGLVATISPLCAAPVDLSKLPPASTQQGVTYAKDIRPLFEASCVRCHGAERPKGGIHLDSLEGALKGGKEGKVIIPGKSEKSQLVIAVSRIDDETAMPPKPKPGRRGQKGPDGAGGAHAEGSASSGTNQPSGRRPMGPPPKPLTLEQVSLVRAWVDQGAK